MKIFSTFCIVIQIMPIILGLALKDTIVRTTSGLNVLMPFKVVLNNGTQIIQTECFCAEQSWKMVYVANSTTNNIEKQDKKFRDRVEIFQGEMDNGNISFVLTNAMVADSGKYACKVITNMEIKDPPAIQLIVSNDSANTWRIIGGVLGVVFVFLIVGLVYKNREDCKRSISQCW